jgi:hypothetical protein
LGRVEKSIEIKAPPEKVWEMLAFDRQTEWDVELQKRLKSLEYTSEVNAPEDKYKVGATAHVDLKGIGMGEVDFEITESIKNEKITFRSSRFSMIMTYILEPLEEGTKFTNVLDYEMHGIFGKIFDKLYAQRVSKEAMEKSSEKLKSILEK